MRTLLAAASIVVVLALGGGASAATAPSGPPTAIGTGGAAASVETLATQAAVDALRRAGMPSTRRFRRRRPRRHRAVLVRESAAAASWSSTATRDGNVTTIDGRETAPAAMTPTSFWGNGKAPASVQRRALQRHVGRRARHLATWAEALEKYGTISLAQALAPGIARRAERVRRRPGVLRPDAGEQAVVRRHAVVGGAVPQPGRHAARRRDGLPQPRPRGAHMSGSRTSGRRGSTAAQSQTRSSTMVQDPPVSPTADHVWRTGRDDDARPARLHGAGTGADAHRLPRARRLRHGPAVERWLDRRARR